jgi:hypothetical protein
MKHGHAVCFAPLALVSVLGVALARQAPNAPKPPEIYPPERNATVVHAFSLPDDVKGDLVRKALAELSTKDADCGIRYGPMKATARPSKVFVLVEAPATVDVKDVIKALKKGATTVEPTAWTCFQSTDSQLGRGLDGGMPGFSPRDFILGMSNDLRWVEARGGFSEFFFLPGKLDADSIKDRFHKLAQPFGVKDVGSLVVETITWPLSGPIDAAAAKRAEKELARISGVQSAKIDVAGLALEVKVVLEGQIRGAPPIALPGGGDALAADGAAAGEKALAPRMRFDTNSFFAVLEKERLSVVATKKESADQGGK